MYIGVKNTFGVAGDAVSGQFPAGLRVLAVEHDPTCLRILERMLESCHYQVTKCSRAEEALKLVRDNKDGFDVVMSAVNMPDMDGVRLLEHIGSETDLPVIMMSADDSTSVVLKCVRGGACDYLIKPVHVKSLRSIWQHVVRKRMHQYMKKDGAVLLPSANMSQYGINDVRAPPVGQLSFPSSPGQPDLPPVANVSQYGINNVRAPPRVDWLADLHQTVNKLETEKKELDKILETMNIPSITKENVVNHLQKYRLSLKRPSDGPILDSKQQCNDVNKTIDSKHTFGDLKMNVHPQIGQPNSLPLASNSEMACILGLLALIMILQG